MTEPLHRDPALSRCEATVIRVTDEGAVVLDRSVFYPTGGGQPGDRGRLRFGGREAELLEDADTLILPVTGEEIEAALRRRRLFPLLDGWRGRPVGDLAAAVSAVLTMQSLLARAPRIVEIEVNPLLVLAGGAVAVDAVIREAET